MPEKSIIIIGAGLAGLSAGCYARMNGYKTQIFEHHSVSGGVVAAWKRKDYLFDGGIHYLMGFKPGQPTFKLYNELHVFDTNKVFDLQSHMSFIDERENRKVHVTSDIEKFQSDLIALSPSDKSAIDAFFNAVRAFRGSNFGLDMEAPPELMTFGQKFIQLKMMLKYFKYFAGKFGRSVSDFTRDLHDPRLKDIFNNLFLPEVPVWFVLMLLAMLADGQLGLVEGGSYDFIKSIENLYTKLGGEISFNSTVDKILVENSKSVGVRLADGREFKADVVISAADGYSTIFNMLEGKFVDNKITERYKTWKLFRPLFMVNLGVNREFKTEPLLSIVKIANPFEINNYRVEWLAIRTFNFSDKFAPPGKTVVQATFETQWDYWNDLRQRDQSEYKKAKESATGMVVSCLENLYPGISNQIEVTDTATPYTTWRFTRNHNGAYEGFLIEPKTVMSRVSRTLPGLDNFYMAGQWVMPGGGVPICLYSGRHSIQVLCKKDNKNFKSSME